MSVIVADWTLVYRGVDITSDIDPMAIQVVYTDKLHGEADEIAVTVEDSKGLWRGPWCPETGDVMQLWYGRNGRRTYAGRFELDEPETDIGRSGDTMVIAGVAAPITKSLRTEKSKEFEEKTVQQIAQEVATEAELTITGSFNNTRYRRKTQRRMRPLEFLAELAEDTDHYMAVRGEEVQFWKVDDIDGADPVATFEVDHRDFTHFRGRFQAADTYTKAKTTHLHDEEKELVEGEETDSRVKTGDTLRIVERVEDAAQAKLMAKGRLHHKNRKRRNGTLTLAARDDIVAGVVIELGSSFGKWAGRYVVDQSSHTLTRGPYPTVCELKEARA